MKRSQQETSMCRAKWLQVTLDLYHGVSKSCHHTPWTQIDPGLVKQNPLHLTNTADVLEDRQHMTKDVMPLSCSFCWHHEQRAPESLSDRYLKSHSDWSTEDHFAKRVNKAEPYQLQTPSYLEVIFDQKCQMSCIYCSADSSSAIEQEIARFGPYDSSVHYHRSKRLVPSPHFKELSQAFQKWLPTLLPKLHTLRISGGEPLFSKPCQNVFSFIDERSQAYVHLILAVNTNLMVHEPLWEKFLSVFKSVSQKVKVFQLFTSLDGAGSDAEYIRRGLDYPVLLKRLNQLLEISKVEVIIMVTYHKYSCRSFKQLLQDLLEIKKKSSLLSIDITALQEPDFLSLKNITEEEYHHMKDSLEFMLLNKSFFSNLEISKMQRVCSMASSYLTSNQVLLQTREQLFKKEYDRRSGSFPVVDFQT